MRRIRDLLVKQRTQLINALRAHLAELGLVADNGRDGLARLISVLRDEAVLSSLPIAMRQALQTVIAQLGSLQQQIGELDRCIRFQHRTDEVSRRLETIPGIGLIGATALAATIAEPSIFRPGGDLAAWIGLVPRQYSTGAGSGSTASRSKADRYLRRLLVRGATAVVQQARRQPEKYHWIASYWRESQRKSLPSL